MFKRFFDLFISKDVFKFDEKKEYSDLDLINILKSQNISIGTGNAIVLHLLEKLIKEKDK